MGIAKKVKIVEVGPRDGLQNETSLDVGQRIAFINQLSATGLRYIEAGAFVSEKRVPQMAQSSLVLDGIERKANTRYSALTPNLKGAQQAIVHNADEIAIFTSSSESFCQRNIHCSIEESLQRFVPVVNMAKEHGIPVRGYLSCAFDCPFEGQTEPLRATKLAQTLHKMGCYEISIGDTLGKATPNRVSLLLTHLQQHIPTSSIAVHFHDTYGQALTNIFQSLQMGIEVVDSSVAGLGGALMLRAQVEMSLPKT